MQDRIVQFPNQYILEPVDGSAPGILVELTPEPGEIIQEGTPLNKATLLSDETATKLWPDAETRPDEPTLNDALSVLADLASKKKFRYHSYAYTGLRGLSVYDK